ncbi:hypothetical protein C2E23DRAFT_893004 [Lenzites betulinus]|nr:hypothetical protein C2E23DRAFT_893004 [Lenzites betulinus]
MPHSNTPTRPSDVYTTARQLATQLYALDERRLDASDRETRLAHTRTDLLAIGAALAAAEAAEGVATAELAATLVRLRAARLRTRPARALSAAALPLAFPFPFTGARCGGLLGRERKSEYESELDVHTPRRGATQHAAPASAPPALVGIPPALPGGGAGVARLARDVLARRVAAHNDSINKLNVQSPSSSSPRRPLRADPAGSLSASSHSPSSPVSSPAERARTLRALLQVHASSAQSARELSAAEIALARTLHAFHASQSPRASVPAGLRIPPYGTKAPDDRHQDRSNASVGVLKLALDPDVRAVPLGTHVVAVGRWADEVAEAEAAENAAMLSPNQSRIQRPTECQSPSPSPRRGRSAGAAHSLSAALAGRVRARGGMLRTDADAAEDEVMAQVPVQLQVQAQVQGHGVERLGAHVITPAPAPARSDWSAPFSWGVFSFSSTGTPTSAGKTTRRKMGRWLAHKGHAQSSDSEGSDHTVKKTRRAKGKGKGKGKAGAMGGAKERFVRAVTVRRRRFGLDRRNSHGIDGGEEGGESTSIVTSDSAVRA